jgi:hypothetical protein
MCKRALFGDTGILTRHVGKAEYLYNKSDGIVPTAKHPARGMEVGTGCEANPHIAFRKTTRPLSFTRCVKVKPCAALNFMRNRDAKVEELVSATQH